MTSRGGTMIVRFRAGGGPLERELLRRSAGTDLTPSDVAKRDLERYYSEGAHLLPLVAAERDKLRGLLTDLTGLTTVGWCLWHPKERRIVDISGRQIVAHEDAQRQADEALRHDGLVLEVRPVCVR